MYMYPTKTSPCLQQIHRAPKHETLCWPPTDYGLEGPTAAGATDEPEAPAYASEVNYGNGAHQCRRDESYKLP
jgi:hypothetical protein